MAEAFARIFGGADMEAYSAGSRPSGVVNPKAIANDLFVLLSKALADFPDIEYDFVATMGCGDVWPFVQAMRRED